MSSIAFFPCTFTPVTDVAQSSSEALDLKLYDDDELVTEASLKHGISKGKLEKAIYDRTSVFNQFTLEREKMINLLRFVLAEKLAQEEQYLFFGFMTALIPNRISHVLRTLIVDTKQNRIENGINGGLSEKEVKRTIHYDDVRAYNLTDFLYKKEAYDSSLYDLVVTTEKKSPKELEETVSHYFRTTSLLKTEQSLQAVHDMLLELKVEKALLQKGHLMAVNANDRKIQLKVQKSVMNFDRLAGELTEIASQVDGVGEIVVEKGYNYHESIYRRQKFDLPSKVLFVDDEKDFVQTVSERLISRDVGTYGVFNGEDALNLIEQDRPDVMVLDLKMPGLYGVEVLRQTKKIAPEVEVIILTGHGTNKDMQDCMELGAFAYMNKPVDIEELSATIKAANEKAMSRATDAR